ncbi:MAG: ribonuclease, partial [Solirubrobacteraceae bacterium]|nr:ribonuclease [Solirubrobacteraceae bacterium]
MSGVEHEGGAAALIERGRRAGRLALDTEFMGEGRYRTLLCLIQLAVPEQDGAGESIALLDPLDDAVELGPLAAALE